jgi:hypothetical protein
LFCLPAVLTFSQTDVGRLLQDNFVTLLLRILQIPSPEFCDSAYALVGSLARNCPALLAPKLHVIVPVLLRV